MDQNFPSQFLFPAIVAVLSAIFSFLGTYYLGKIKFKEERRNKRKEFVQNLNLILKKITNIFQKLKEDNEQKRYFDLKTLDMAKSSYISLKELYNNVNIVDNDKLINSILDLFDNIILILEDIDVTERFLVNQYTEMLSANMELQKELRLIKIKIINKNYLVDENNKVNNTNNNSTNDNKKEIENLQKIIDEILSQINESKNKLESNYIDSGRRRTIFAMRIIDAESKIRPVLAELNNNYLNQ